ncbi:MAG: glycine betaine ABC transporter substrate-binding protein [Ectothiorhodospira sp.]
MRLQRLFWTGRWIVVLHFLLFLFVLIGCAPEDPSPSPEADDDGVRLVYVEWDSEIASTHVVKAVIEERLGLECELLPVTLTALWASVAAGDQDATVSAWLPLQADQQAEYGDRLVDLGPHVEGTRIGLAVPSHLPVTSIPELTGFADRLDGKIIGIEPDAGLMQRTREALEAYGLDGLQLISGSGSTMTTILEGALEEDRWIVVTAWTPHWKFRRWDLRYLEDPRGIYGEKGAIHTLVRRGLKADRPRVYEFLSRFHWTVRDMEEVMLLMQNEGISPAEAARRWIGANRAQVDGWLHE